MFESYSIESGTRRESRTEKRIGAELLISRLEDAVGKIREGENYPGNPEWYGNMVKAIELIKRSDPVGHLGEEDLYATGDLPQCIGENLTNPDGSLGAQLWRLQHVVAVSEHGMGEEIYLSAPPEQWAELDGSNGQIFAPKH